MSDRSYNIRGEEREWGVSFDTDLTLGENLKAHLENLVAFGIVPQDIPVSRLQVRYGDRILNPEVAVEEQIPGIPERSLLRLEVIETQVDLRIRYQPDHANEKSRTIAVAVAEPLGEQLNEFFTGLHQHHKFRGFRRRKYRLQREVDVAEGSDERVGNTPRARREPLRLDRSLERQGIRAATTACILPPVLGVPFRALEWILAGLLAVLVAVGVWFIIPLINPPHYVAIAVTLTADTRCHILWDSGDTLTTIWDPGGQSEPVQMQRSQDKYQVRVYPDRQPLYKFSFYVEPERGVREMSIRVTSPNEVATSTINLEIEAYWAKRQEDIDQENYGDHVENDLLLNRWPYPVPTETDDDLLSAGASVGIVRIDSLPLGVYEIEHSVPDGLPPARAYPFDRLRRIKVGGKDCLWDFSEYLPGNRKYERLIFWYLRDEG